MDQDKYREQYSPNIKTSLTSLAQIRGDASSDDDILIKREDTSVSFGSPQADLLNPIIKKLKVEAGLQGGYEPKTEIFVARVENVNVPPVKEEETCHNFNVKLEDSHSQTAGQEDSEKPEFDKIHLKEEPYRSEDSTSGKSKRDGSYSPAKPKTLCDPEELAGQIKEQAKKQKSAESHRNWLKKNKEKSAEIGRIYYQNNKEKRNESSRKWQRNNKEKSAEIGRIYYQKNKDRINESSKKWQQNNKEKSVEIHRNWHINNKERCNESARNWHKNNKEKSAAQRRNWLQGKAEYQKNYYQINKEKIAERRRNRCESKEEESARQPQIGNQAQSNSVEPQPGCRSEVKQEDC